MKKHSLMLLLLIALMYWTIQPLFGGGYFTMHDDTQVGRVIVMGRALRSGQFPVRWISDLGYGFGYPLYNFYGPLPYYFGGTLYAVGVDAVAATKIMMGVGMVLSALFMYVLVQFLFGRLAGVLAAVLYGYAPYHAVQLYVRGAVGELWAYALLPLLFLGLFLGTSATRRKDGMWIGGLGLAGIILSHTISGYVTVAFYVACLVLYATYASITSLFRHSRPVSQYGVNSSGNPSSIKDWILGACPRPDRGSSPRMTYRFHLSLLAIGLGLSAFFWLPAFIEMGYTNVAGQIGATAYFRDHFVCISQLWNSPWGYGGSAPGCVDGMSFKIGKLHVLLGVLGLGLAALRLKNDFFRHALGLISMIGLGSTVMVTSFSQPVWELVPEFVYIQYPWRILAGVVFAASVLGGSVLYWIRQRWAKVGFFAFMLFAIFGLNAKLFTPQIAYDKPVSFFESDEELLWRVSKVSDEYLPPSFSKPANPQGVAREILASDKNRGLAVETEIDTETYAKLHVQAQTPISVTLSRAYFPGWQYWVNGVRQNAQIANGLPNISIPIGRSVVELRLGSTPARLIGNILSMVVTLWFLRTYGKKSIA